MSNTGPFTIAEQVAKQAGYQYEQLNDRVWKFLFTGRHMKEIDVLAVWQGHLFILGVIMASRQYLKESTPLLEHLLLLNNNLDRVKIGYNSEHMLFVRVDLSLRMMDAQEFKEALDQVSAAADYIFSIIQPYIDIPSAATTSETVATEE
jgi:hypothetical protein